MKVCFTSISIFVSDTRSLPIEGNFSQIFISTLSLQKSLLCLSRCVCKFNGQILLRQPAGLSITRSALF